MTIATVIVDDEPLGRCALADLCQQHPDVNVVASCGSGAEAISATREWHPQLLLLDVQMKPQNGLEVAAALGAAQGPSIVFVTAYDRFAVRAFELNALDYLLKPVHPARFAQTLERIRQQGAAPLLDKQRDALTALVADSLRELQDATAHGLPGRLMVEADGRALFLNPAAIEYVESHGNYVTLRVGEQSHTVRATLTDLEARLPASMFLRLHRSIIVNIARIRSMERQFCGEFAVEMESRHRFRTGRTYRKRLHAYLLRSKTIPLQSNVS
jgi:two-component system, LytTR family, response regulator